MGRLADTFARCRAAGEIAFIPGFVPGDPDLGRALEIVRALAAGGADAIELSYSFSDPVADGTTLQAAHGRALAGGLTKSQAYQWIGQARTAIDQPILVLEYANCIYRFGIDRFYQTLADNGADSAIAIDVPLEEAGPFRDAANRAGIGCTFLISPSTSEARLKRIASAAQDWLYVVAVAGTTGARQAVQTSAGDLLARARMATDLPLVVGFGISRPDHVRQVAEQGASGAISCSAVVDLIHRHAEPGGRLAEEVSSYVSTMKAATRPRGVAMA
ncbi:MAG: tryptophan synthase subunit alpha [Chloroflexota bacterium]